MASYPKIWTSILDEPWFIDLSINQRGMILQLILDAKVQQDTGVVCYKSVSHLAHRLGADRSCVGRALLRFQQENILRLVDKSTTHITIEVCKYKKYQDLVKWVVRENQQETKNEPVDKPHPINQTEINQIEYNIIPPSAKPISDKKAQEKKELEEDVKVIFNFYLETMKLTDNSYLLTKSRKQKIIARYKEFEKLGLDPIRSC